jgi:hypothetical protein
MNRDELLRLDRIAGLATSAVTSAKDVEVVDAVHAALAEEAAALPREHVIHRRA